jgi:hypothetical protein
MTKSEIETIRNIVARLKADRLGAAEGGDYVLDLSHGARLYVDTWLIAPLEMLLPETRNVDLAVRMSRH